MFRFITITLLSSLAFSFTGAQDFSWDIKSVQDYPIIGFNSESANSEVEFKYNYTGILSDNKFLETKLYRDDCVTPADESLAFVDLIEGNELSLDVDIVQETITNSVHYTQTDDLGTSAAISFCVRVDYNYKDFDGNTESINFHETIVDISVDLTANFTLTSIATDRTAADAETADAALDYPVTAYFCVDDNSANSPDPLAQGSVLQVCVKMDDSVTEDVYVSNILTFVVSQPDGPASSSTNIAETVTDPLTAKDCTSNSDGICNVKTQLPSKFFTDPSPADLQVDGVAILAFGLPGRRQLVAVPIQQTLRKTQAESRKLQDAANTEGNDASGSNRDFNMQVGLAKQQPPVAASDSSMGMMLAVVVVLILIVVAIVAYCCCFGGASKKNRHEEEQYYEGEGEENFTPVTRTTMMKQQQSSQATVSSQNSQMSLSSAYAV